MPATTSNRAPINGIVEVISAEAPSAFIGSPVLVSQKRVKRGAVCLITVILGVLLAIFSCVYLVNGSLSFEEAAAPDIIIPTMQTGYEVVKLPPDLVKCVEAGETLKVVVSRGSNKTAVIPVTSQGQKTLSSRSSHCTRERES